MKYLVVHPVFDRASRGWRGLTMTPKALRLLQDLRPEPFTPLLGRHRAWLSRE